MNESKQILVVTEVEGGLQVTGSMTAHELVTVGIELLVKAVNHIDDIKDRAEAVANLTTQLALRTAPNRKPKE